MDTEPRCDACDNITEADYTFFESSPRLKYLDGLSLLVALVAFGVFGVCLVFAIIATYLSFQDIQDDFDDKFYHGTLLEA